MFKQHIPGFVDSKPKLSIADTLELVLELDFVKSWERKKGFHKWVKQGRSLIAVFDEGRVWWVVGYPDFDLDLPEFKDNVIIEEPEPITYSGGIQIKQDGQYWMIWRPSKDGRAMLGYHGDSETWRYGMAQRYPSESVAQKVADKLRELECH